MNEFEFLLGAYHESQKVKADLLDTYLNASINNPAFNPTFDAALAQASGEADAISAQLIAACVSAAEGIDHTEPGD